MNDSYILVDDSSDDESIFVNHGLTQTPRKNVLIDSSDDEFTPQRKIKNVMQECIDIDSSDDDAPVGGRSNEDDDLTDKMKKLTMESEDSAWAYDKERNEFLLTRAEFENGNCLAELLTSSQTLRISISSSKVGVQWAASMHSHKIGGILQTQRKDRLRVLRSALSGEKRMQHLIITSYGLISNDPRDFVCGHQGFDYVVLDEAHKIKNDSTQVTSGCRRVCACDNTRRLLLTGTPIQNNLKEMWVLFDFATSGKVLGPYRRFKKDFGDPIELGRNKNATESTVEAAQRANLKLQTLLKPYFLQRMKADVLSDMPPKQEFVVWTHLSPVQRRRYEDYVTTSDTVNAVLSIMIGSNQLDRLDVATLLEQSAKLEVLCGLIQRLSTSGHRTLIFSNSTMTLDIIQRVLHGLNISRIDGTTKENDRQRSVEEFNQEGSNVDVMLLSTKAGGLGLTLTGADRAVIYNPSWNPTDDSQAVDRCYRIGQKKSVEVYRFIAAGTVEEKTYEKQIFKDGINRVVTSSTGNKTERYFDKKDLSRLFKLAPPGKCELLEKLQEKGRVGDVSTSRQGVFFAKHKGVIGLSRHDAVYMEGTTGSLDSSPPHSPFGGPTPVKIAGKARRVLLGKPAVVVPVNHDRKNPQSVDTQNRCNGVHPYAPPTPIHANQHNNRLSLGASPSRFETAKAVITTLKSEGRHSKALRCLLDLLDDQEHLMKEQRLWMHQQISHVSSCLGYLPT
ncbi:hypothetical protein MHU86_22696 [Fragilaria crotonensis]|nr:hypothetical protein MHU86_22696 [Fragilaria crotonensis]